jgi:hypothetical protein
MPHEMPCNARMRHRISGNEASCKPPAQLAPSTLSAANFDSSTTGAGFRRQSTAIITCWCTHTTRNRNFSKSASPSTMRDVPVPPRRLRVARVRLPRFNYFFWRSCDSASRPVDQSLQSSSKLESSNGAANEISAPGMEHDLTSICHNEVELLTT